MGRPTPTQPDLALALATGSFTAIGAGVVLEAVNFLNVTVFGTFVGTLTLQRSFDGGIEWIDRGETAFGTPFQFTGPTSFPCFEPETGVLYRLNCTAYTSGTINYRLSR